MFGLLGWLWERSIRLYEWFGPKFNEYRDTVHNIWRDAYNLAVDAYNRAVAWASRQVTWLRSLLDATGRGFTALLQSVSSAIYKWGNGKFAQFIAWVNAVKSEVLTWASSAITQARVDALKWVQTAKDNLWNIARGWTDEVIAWAAPVVRLRHSLADLITLFSPTNKARFIDFIGRGYVQLFNFFDDPRGFIYDRLESTFVSFLCYVLARAIGSDKRELPKTFSYKGE